MADDTRQRILDAAFAEFSANGKAGARMQAIAERAQINQAMLNYYFKSKDDLYAAIVQRAVGECTHEFEPFEIEDKASIREVWLDHIERDIRFWAEKPDLLRLIMHDLLAGGEGMKMAFSEWMDSERSRKLAEHLTADHGFRETDPRQVILHFSSLTFLPLLLLPVVREVWPTTEDEQTFLEARIRAIREFVAHGMFTE